MARFTWAGKRTKAQQRRRRNACISKIILLESNRYHNHGPLTAQDGKKLQVMLQQLSSMESRYDR